MRKYKIAVLGGGNIGTSLARGLIKSGQYTADEIILTEKRVSRISFLQKNGFKVTENNSEAIDQARIVIMTVKPQQFKTLADEIKDCLTTDHILISTITGISHEKIETAFGSLPNVRIMPNTAIEICESMTCISFRNMKEDQKENVSSLFDKMGKTILFPKS